ncbi:MAG: O-antigen ligase family protein [Rhodospirillales bacterium]|nr:O-antigen ligase family protein [Rhodospirillales bacterium]
MAHAEPLADLPRPLEATVKGAARPAAHLWLYPFLGVIALTPIPFGGERPLPAAILSAAIGLLLVISAAQQILKRAEYISLPRRLWPAAISFGAVIVIVAVQMTTWLPVEWRHPLWALAEDVLGAKTAGYGTLDISATGYHLMRLAAYGGVFWLSFAAALDRRVAWRMLRFFAWTGAVYAVYGLGVLVSGTKTILWFKKWAYADFVTSTFVNPNSYATYAGFSVICLAALLLRELGRQTPEFPGMAGRLYTAGRTFGRHWRLAGAFLIVCSALFLSASRAGITSAILGFCVLLGLFVVRQTFGIVARILLVAGSAAFLFLVAQMSGGFFFAKLIGQAGGQFDERQQVYDVAWRAVLDSPYLGYGFGAFEPVFRMYRGESVKWDYVDRAHNTYLETAVGIGLPGTALLVAAIAWVAWLCLNGAVRRQRSYLLPAVGAAVAVQAAVHSLADFSLEIPAVAVSFAFLLGLAAAQAARQNRVNPGT